MKNFLTALLTVLFFNASYGQKGLIISEILANPNGSDSPFEYVELLATIPINFSTTPYTIVVTDNGTATSNGWKAGGSVTYAFQISSGSVSAGQVVYVGGTSMLPLSNGGTSLRSINTGITGGDGFGSSNSSGVIGNGGSNCDGVAVFDVAASSVNSSRVPVDAVFFGTGIGSAFKTTGSGYQLPVNDKYNGGKLLTSSYIAPDPAADELVKATGGVFDPSTGTFTTARTWSVTSTPSYNSTLITLSGGSNVLPSVSITTPSNGAVYSEPASISISATASDSDGAISKVEFYNGSSLLGTDTSSPYGFSWTSVAAGSYSITAKAYDNVNATTTSSVVSVTVNGSGTNQAPAVSITSPANGAVFVAPASVTISASASDADGSVSKVEFYNGATLLGTDTSSPYSYAWSSVATGSYSLTAKAYDNLNLSTVSSVVSIVVNATNAAPTIAFLPSASTYVDEASGKISCVRNNPTDPVIVTGLDFTVTDEDLSSLTFQMTSSKTSVVANGSFTISGTGNNRKIKIAPAGVGYATITLKVTDNGAKTAQISFSLAVSNAITTATVNDYYHTGMSDGSTAIAIDANYMFVADDETNEIRLYNRNTSGLPVYKFNVAPFLSLSGKEIDIEGSFVSPTNPNRIYWLGSMSNNKDAESRPDRNRLFATDVVGSGANATLTFVGYYSNLRSKITAWGDSYGYNLSAKAAAGVDPKTIDGFNVEGFEMGPDGTTAYIGFRAPYVPASTKNKALICPLTNFESWFNNGTPSGNPTFGAPIEINLNSRGIRSLGKNASNEYLIIAGGYDDTQSFALYSWNGLASSAPVQLSADLTGLRPEGIAEVPASLSGSFQLQLISDLGSTIWYNDAIENKDLTTPNYQKFVSSIVSVSGGARIASYETEASEGHMILAYPNPVQSFVSVDFGVENIAQDKYYIYTAEGVLVKELVAISNGNTIDFDLTGLRTGNYVIYSRELKKAVKVAKQ